VIVTGAVGDAFTEVGVPKEVDGTPFGGGAGASGVTDRTTDTGLDVADVPVATSLVAETAKVKRSPPRNPVSVVDVALGPIDTGEPVTPVVASKGTTTKPVSELPPSVTGSAHETVAEPGDEPAVAKGESGAEGADGQVVVVHQLA
jgi:hypothetical protein